MMYFGLLLVVLVLVWSVSTHVHYVLPDGSSPLNCPAQPCLTLDQYTQHTQTYFTIGATFLFLAGNHTLQTTLTLTNISDLTLRGEGNDSQVNIICRNCVIECDNITNLNIEKLIFFIVYFNKTSGVPLNISSSDGVKISDCTFQGSGALLTAEREILYMLHSSDIKILSCEFRNISRSGAIYVGHSVNFTASGSTFVGNRGYFGGAMNIDSTNLMISRSKFIENISRESGGAIYIMDGHLTLEEHLGTTVFAHNSATGDGGAIYCEDCTISVTRNCTTKQDEFDCSTHFFNNTSNNKGGAIQLSGQRPFLSLNGTNIVFTDNKARRDGGAISATAYEYGQGDCSLQVLGLSILFEGNKAGYDGGAIDVTNCRALLDGRNIELKNNMAHTGGAIAIDRSDLLTCTMSVKYINNTAMQYGGAIAIVYIARIAIVPMYTLIQGTFANNSCEHGGAVYIRIFTVHKVTLQDITAVNNSGSALYLDEVTVTFNGTINLSENIGRLGGGIYAKNAVITLLGHTCLVNNKATVNGGGIYTVSGKLSLNGDMLFSQNTADRDGGALYATDAEITLNNRVNFTSNTAQNGGAMFISATSLTLNHQTTITTSHNHASLYGGAIYHEDKPTQYICSNPKRDISRNSPVCFLRLIKYKEAVITSLHDSADVDGAFLYGGLLDKCILNVNGTYNYSIIPHNFLNAGILNITPSQKKINEIASMPYRLMFCDDPPNYYDKSVSVSRGQSFIISVQAIDGITPVQVTALPGINARVHLNQVIRIASSRCTNFTYNFYSSPDHNELRLTTRGSCGDTGTVQAVIRVTLLPCNPPLIHVNEKCACDKRLLEYPNVNCTTDENNNSYVTKTSGIDFWMSVLYDSNGFYEGLILYRTCPPEYCKTGTVRVSLDDLDSQCDDNRGGVLCGQCLANYSLMLGSSKCRHCSHQHMALFLPFVAAGIALVVFLSFLRLTVATAMVNSVILYANILQVNRNFIFPVNARNVLTVFIAWMNLDLGFETCFYGGMTAYAQTWLQFAFPLYVWILISLMILSSRYSITVSRLIGHNPIAVLATLILMSYTKLLKIIIEVYSSVMLSYPDNRTVTVWLKDANVPYLQSWHLLLTVVTTLVLVLFFLPYTLLLLLGYKLYRFAGRKYFRWFHKIRPLLESYYAPYKIHTRYWTGFLLLVRCILYIIFSFYSLENTNKSLLAIILTFTSLLILLLMLLLCFSHQLYTKLHNNMMEISIYLNLIVISAATLAGVNSPALVYSLVGLVFGTMLGIIAYHFHLLYIVKSQVWQQFKVKVSTLKEKLTHLATETAAEPPVDAVKSSPAPSKVVTHSEIELREPLL